MYRTILCSTGNPDHGQFVAVSPSAVAMVNSIEEAVTVCGHTFPSGISVEVTGVVMQGKFFCQTSSLPGLLTMERYYKSNKWPM